MQPTIAPVMILQSILTLLLPFIIFINDILKDGVEPIHSEHYRDGYTCFYKTICKGMRLPDKELAETDPEAYESQLAAVTAALKRDI